MHKRTGRRREKQVHTVSATLKIPALTKALSSLKLQIKADEQKIGELVIGRGAIYWAGRHRKYLNRISWSRFAKIMDEHVYG